MWIAAPVVLLGLCIAIYFFVWRGYATGKNLIVALQAVNSGPAQSELVLKSFERALSYDTLGRAEVVERVVEAARQMNAAQVPIETRQKFFKLGEEAVKTQLERYKGDARYEVFAGNFYTIYGNIPEAVSHFEKAVELSPKKQTIIFQLGAAYVSSRQYDKAVEVLKKAYELEPSYADALRYYATALMYAGREAEARKLFPAGTTAQAIDQAFLSVYADLGNWSKVAAILRGLIAADPNNMELRMNLVAAYFQAGNKAAAIATLREMIAVNPAFKEQGEKYIQEIQATP
jgi:tetratricopeptide (TPR) repeat protein